MNISSLPGLISLLCIARWKAARCSLFLAGLISSGGLLLASAAMTTTTTMTLTSDGMPVTTVEPHTAITLTATIEAGSTVLKQGQVKFCDAASSCQDIHLLGLQQLTAAGTATLKVVAGPGKHSYKAVFVGTNSAAPSASSASTILVVMSEAYMTKTNLTATGSAGSYTLKADVRGVGTTEAPTGSVYFQDRSDSGAELGKARLSTVSSELSWSLSHFGKLHSILYDSMVTADFNGDGHADLVLVDSFHGVSVLLGDGQGHFTVSPVPFVFRNYGSVTAVGDFNNDGKSDVILAPGNLGDPLIVLLGKGDGTFTPIEDTGVSLTQPYYVAGGDFNGDGNADLALSSRYAYDGVQIYLGNGDGTFSTSTRIGEKYNTPFIAGDFDGDGKTDLALEDTNSTYYGVIVYYGNGDGSFLRKTVGRGSFGPLSAGDVNGDGRTDLILSVDAYPSPYVYTLLGNADRTLTRKAPVLAPGYLFNHFTPVLADFNGDGIVDLAYGDGDGVHPMNVLLGDGKGKFSLASASGVPFVRDYGLLYVAADFNEDGVPDLAGVSAPNLSDSAYSVYFTQRSLAVKVSGKAPEGPGSHEVVARYAGDDKFSASVSKPLELSALLGAAPIANLSTLAIPFGAGDVGEPSSAKTVVLTNTGTAVLAIGGFDLSPVSGPGVSFATSNNCPASLAKGASCKIRFRFVPGSVGTKTSQLAITDNAGNSPQVITLTGTGIDAP